MVEGLKFKGFKDFQVASLENGVTIWHLTGSKALILTKRFLLYCYDTLFLMYLWAVSIVRITNLKFTQI